MAAQTTRRPIDHLRAEGITHSYGDRRVFSDIDLTVDSGQRVGLIGENGAGKSTLLRILSGEEQPDDGTVVVPPGVGLLRQELAYLPGDRIVDVVETALAEVRAIERELELAASALNTGGEPDARAVADRYSAALDAAERADIWTVDARREEIFTGLGIGHLSPGRPVDEISGGQRSRLALAVLLLRRPTALLLDEPTNHLDDAAADFLKRTLAGWAGPVIFASHDRAFLDEAATVIVDIDPSRGGVRRFGTAGAGTYTAYLAEKAAERSRWEEQFAFEQAELGRLNEVVRVSAHNLAPGRGPRDNDKMGYDFKGGHHARQVSRRIRNARGRFDDLADRRVGEPPALLAFGGIPHGTNPLESDEVLIGLSVAGVDGRLDDATIQIRPVTSLLVTGPNGAGKSTLLGALAGTIALDTGARRHRKGLRVALLEQDVRFARPHASPRQMYDAAVGGRRADAVPLASLGLLAGRDLDTPVGRLSVGQQRRFALALIVARPPHVFLLDEPTNHLSLALATELEDALGRYPGAVVIASHDRWLRRRWQGEHLRMNRGRVGEHAS